MYIKKEDQLAIHQKNTKTAIIGTMSRFRFLLALVAIGVVGGVNGKPPKRIRGGAVVTDDAHFTGTVTLARPGNFIHTCGGGIIGPRHVLTAAHCVEKRTSSDITVRPGVHDIRDRVDEIRVKKVIIHPRYISHTEKRHVQNDLAMLVLEEDLPLGNGRIEKYSLPTHAPEYGAFFVAGWGDNDVDPVFYQFQLKKLTMLLGGPGKCNGFVPQTFCTYAEHGAICPGDSGSPLIQGGKIYGITSTASCLFGSVAYFVNVYHFLDWIQMTMRLNP